MTSLRQNLIAPFLLLAGGGALQAHGGLIEHASLDITVPSTVQLQVVDAQGHFSGVDFKTAIVQTDLPESTYDANEALDDDETGQPDTHPIQHFEIVYSASQTYTLKIHPTKSGTFRGHVVVGDRKGNGKRFNLVVVAKKNLAVQEYRLELDPMDATKCRLIRIKH